METLILASKFEWLFLLMLAFFIFTALCTTIGFGLLSSKSFIKKFEQKNNSRRVMIHSKKPFVVSLFLSIFAIYFLGGRFFQVSTIDVTDDGKLCFKNGWNIPLGSVQKENLREIRSLGMQSIRGYKYGRVIITTNEKTYTGVRYTSERANFIKQKLDALKSL